MAQLVPPLSAYGLSKDCGFLSSAPVPALADPYYAEWESVLAGLQPLLQNGGLRAAVDGLPILSTSHLQTELQWKRAYLLLVSMLQGYVWSGAEPSEVSPLLRLPEMYSHIFSAYRLLSQSPLSKSASIWNYLQWPPMLGFVYGIMYHAVRLGP